MSIWGTILAFDAGHHAEECRQWVECTCGDHMRHPIDSGLAFGDDRHWCRNPNLACSCLDGPIAYQRSHIMPADSDPRAGTFQVAGISGDLPHNGTELDPDGYQMYPWLRFTLRGSDDEPDDVVLTAAQVEALHLELTGWLVRAGRLAEEKETTSA